MKTDELNVLKDFIQNLKDISEKYDIPIVIASQEINELDFYMNSDKYQLSFKDIACSNQINSVIDISDMRGVGS